MLFVGYTIRGLGRTRTVNAKIKEEAPSCPDIDGLWDIGLLEIKSLFEVQCRFTEIPRREDCEKNSVNCDV